MMQAFSKGHFTMTKRIIMIHGRSTKSSQASHVALWKRALMEGLRRVGKEAATKAAIQAGTLTVEVVYYGDICNRILAANSKKHRDSLTSRDPANGNAPCLPEGHIESALQRLFAIPDYTKAAYRKVVRNSPQTLVLDEAASFFSALGAFASLGSVNTALIGAGLSDLRAYFHEHAVASEIRSRLHQVLDPAVRNADDICLISHSLGCMVSYDALWKISRRSEFAPIRANSGRVAKWVTIGCPLGEIGVQNNLLDAGFFRTDKFPKDIITDWVNFAAHDDFVAHEPKMKTNDNYARFVGNEVASITDRRLWNCYEQLNAPNPHKAYGYLANPKLGTAVAEWAGL